MSPRPDVSAERKPEILEAALNVFGRKGYTAARMEDVAKEAGLSVGILYWYFKGKSEIILSLLNLLLEPDVQRLSEALNAPGTSRARLFALFQKGLESEKKPAAIFFTNEMYHLAKHVKEVRALLEEYQAGYLAGVAILIEQGMARCELRPDLDPRAVALSLQFIYDGILLNLPFLPKNASLPGILEQSFAMLFEGLEEHGLEKP